MRKKTVLLSAVLSLGLMAGFGMAVQAADDAETPETNALGIVEAEQWADKYPEIVESYLANGDNSEAYSYVEEHPEIVTLYEGMGFSKDYNSARGHSYTLEDVQATERPHPLSNCLACKTADYVELLNKYGVDFYSMSFEDAVAEMNEPITCYDCHQNDPSAGAAPIRQPMIDAVGEDYENINSSVLSCAQCHNEYYFEPENKAVAHPYSGIAAATPDQILAFYNEMGFSDYQNPRTLTDQIKVQHPEFETFMADGSLHKALSCADCHMEKATSADGTEYRSHTWTSPLASQSIMDNTCAACHGDAETVTEKVKTVQEEITGRETEVAGKLVELTEKLAEAVEGGEYSEEELAKIRALNRDAQFYWDFVFVENSEGAHNSKLSRECLDKSEELTAEAMALFH